MPDDGPAASRRQPLPFTLDTATTLIRHVAGEYAAVFAEIDEEELRFAIALQTMERFSFGVVNAVSAIRAARVSDSDEQHAQRLRTAVGTAVNAASAIVAMLPEFGDIVDREEFMNAVLGREKSH